MGNYIAQAMKRPMEKEDIFLNQHTLWSILTKRWVFDIAVLPTEPHSQIKYKLLTFRSHCKNRGILDVVQMAVNESSKSDVMSFHDGTQIRIADFLARPKSFESFLATRFEDEKHFSFTTKDSEYFLGRWKSHILTLKDQH